MKYLERIDRASVRRNDLLVIGELKIGNPIRLDAIGKGIRADLTRFSVSDALPHFRSIFDLTLVDSRNFQLLNLTLFFFDLFPCS